MSDLSLIAAVSNKPAVWDKRSELHTNRHLVDRCWKEISAEMKADETKLRKKWKYFRDQFAVELGKIEASKQDEFRLGNVYTPKWPFFKSLLFLKVIVRPRAPSGKFNREPAPVSSTESTVIDRSPDRDDSEVIDADFKIEQEDECFEVDPFIDINNLRSIPSTRSSSVPGNRKRKKSVNVSKQDLEDVQHKRPQYSKEEPRQKDIDGNEDDEHLHFFKSLLPHVREIPTSKILSFRSRIQDVVDQFAYKSSQVESPP